MLSVVAVDVNGVPGEGFFQLAEKLGRISSGEGPNEFLKKKRKLVYATWNRKITLDKYQRKPRA